MNVSNLPVCAPLYSQLQRLEEEEEGGGRRSENLVGERGEASRDEAGPIHLFHRIGSDSAECDVM